MDPEARRNRVDRRVVDLAQAALNRLDDIHEPSAVRPEFLDDGVDYRRYLRCNRGGPRLRCRHCCFLCIRRHHQLLQNQMRRTADAPIVEALALPLPNAASGAASLPPRPPAKRQDPKVRTATPGGGRHVKPPSKRRHDHPAIECSGLRIAARRRPPSPDKALRGRFADAVTSNR